MSEEVQPPAPWWPAANLQLNEAFISAVARGIGLLPVTQGQRSVLRLPPDTTGRAVTLRYNPWCARRTRSRRMGLTAAPRSAGGHAQMKAFCAPVIRLEYLMIHQ
jgi:hypothetical protein